jgi:hypothetical protein
LWHPWNWWCRSRFARQAKERSGIGHPAWHGTKRMKLMLMLLLIGETTSQQTSKAGSLHRELQEEDSHTPDEAAAEEALAKRPSAQEAMAEGDIVAVLKIGAAETPVLELERKKPANSCKLMVDEPPQRHDGRQRPA